MGIYIPSMTLPHKNELIVIRSSGGVEPIAMAFKAVIQFSPHEAQEVIEVPSHGRLIDADANIKAIDPCIENPEDEIAREFYKYAKSILNACPTIIPADPEGGADG